MYSTTALIETIIAINMIVIISTLTTLTTAFITATFLLTEAIFHVISALLSELFFYLSLVVSIGPLGSSKELCKKERDMVKNKEVNMITPL